MIISKFKMNSIVLAVVLSASFSSAFASNVNTSRNQAASVTQSINYQNSKLFSIHDIYILGQHIATHTYIHGQAKGWW
ncbi:MAG: hypothetical protein R3Y52_00815 [Psittacicella sp.]